MDQTGICNYALVKIGGDTINSITESSRNARALNAVWTPVVDEILAEADWPFAIHTKTLALLASAPDRTDYSYQFALPSDPPFIRMVDIPDYPEIAYEIEGANLLVNAEEITIRYIKRITNTALFPPAFVNALACRLAAEIAIEVTDSLQVRGQMLSEYNTALIVAIGEALYQQKPRLPEKLWTER